MRRTALGTTLGALTLTATMAWASNIRVDGKLISTEQSEAPLEVASDVKVANLNADLLDGMDASDFATATQVASVYNQAFFTADATFVVPTGVTVLEVTVIGAGGGGSGSSASDRGGFGGGSGLVVTTAVTVAPGDSLSIVIGSGGQGETGEQNGGDGESSELSSNEGSWSVEAAGGEGGCTVMDRRGGNGLFGGGSGSGIPTEVLGGDGIFGDGQVGDFEQAGDGASGGVGGTGEGTGGGGGGPGGGDGGQPGEAGDAGHQPGAGGGGASWENPGGDGAGGAVLLRWVGPPAAI